VSFTGKVSGGSGGLRYYWSGLPGGCSAPKSPALTFRCAPTASGTFVPTLYANDSNEANISANATLNVQPAVLGLPAVEGEAIIAGAALAGVGLGIAALVLHLLKRRRARPKFEF
jgi:hypothetical protein